MIRFIDLPAEKTPKVVKALEQVGVPHKDGAGVRLQSEPPAKPSGKAKRARRK